MTSIYRPITEPLRHDISREEKWEAFDKGLITCWENGRKLAATTPTLATQCKNGELPPLNWKGGVARPLKKKEKFGSLNYLASWLGLRGDDLQINMDMEITIICTRTKMSVTFTPDIQKLANDSGDP